MKLNLRIDSYQELILSLCSVQVHYLTITRGRLIINATHEN